MTVHRKTIKKIVRAVKGIGKGFTKKQRATFVKRARKRKEVTVSTIRKRRKRRKTIKK
jgi:hypothetical protein